MTTLAPPPAVTAFANAVRDHLAGLDAETMDELTGGLEADLAEALAERSPDGGAADLAAVTAVFGSPDRYAEELRVAAGVELPEPTPARRPTLRALVGRQLSELGDDWRQWRGEHRWVNAVIDFAVALRPVWWVLRAWVLFQLLTGLRNPFFGSGLQLLLLLGLVVASVLWGQRRMGQQRWWRRIGLLISGICLIAAIPTAVQVYNRVAYPSYSSTGYEQGYSDGQSAADRQSALEGDLANLFVYDAQGLPVENAQIIDQHGNPVVLTSSPTGDSWATWDGWSWDGEAVPAGVLDSGALNVYPWSYVGPEHLTWGDDGAVGGDPADADDPRWPAASLFPVLTETTTDPAGDPEQSATSDESEAGNAGPSDDPDERQPSDEPTDDPSA